MPTRGRKPKLTVVGGSESGAHNPGKRSKPEQTLEVEVPDEPDWREHFPVTRGAQADNNRRARATAREEWRNVVPRLEKRGTLTGLDRTALVDYCVVTARVRQLERTLSVEGFTVRSDRGGVAKHPAAVALNQYRIALGRYTAQFGLVPAERVRIPAASGSSPGDELWD